MMRKLYFRVDSNPMIANGHVMRCLSIADAAYDLGIAPVFISSDDNVASIVKSRGYACIVLGTKWDNLDSEIEQMSRIIERESITKLIVDSYSVTYKYLKRLSEITSVVYIDDLNAFDYPVDTIICYANYYRKFEFEKRFPEKTLLLGCEYVPLRKEFRNLGPKVIKEEIENLLILSGGSDNYHVVKNILNSIDVKSYKRINAICGRYNTDYDELVEKYSSSDVVKVHKDVNNIIDYMKDADLAISAGGSTLYELCACGTPTISYAIADNQLYNVRGFDKCSIISCLGDLRCSNIFTNLNSLFLKYDYEYRCYISQKERDLVDGNGAFRIVEMLTKHQSYLVSRL